MQLGAFGVCLLSSSYLPEHLFHARKICEIRLCDNWIIPEDAKTLTLKGLYNYYLNRPDSAKILGSSKLGKGLTKGTYVALELYVDINAVSHSYILGKLKIPNVPPVSPAGGTIGRRRQHQKSKWKEGKGSGRRQQQAHQGYTRQVSIEFSNQTVYSIFFSSDYPNVQIPAEWTSTSYGSLRCRGLHHVHFY